MEAENETKSGSDRFCPTKLVVYKFTRLKRARESGCDALTRPGEKVGYNVAQGNSLISHLDKSGTNNHHINRG